MEATIENLREKIRKGMIHNINSVYGNELLEMTDKIIAEQTKDKGNVRSLILRKEVLWTEIKASEQEYLRISKQIDELITAQKDISFRIQVKIAEGQDIAEKLHEIEAKTLISLGL